MRVIINGEQREIASRHVDALLGELEYEGTHFAIALNYDVLPKSRWAQTALKNGDEIEIITPRQGGGWDDARPPNSAIIVRLDRTIQYAAASRFNHERLWNAGSPLSRG